MIADGKLRPAGDLESARIARDLATATATARDLHGELKQAAACLRTHVTEKVELKRRADALAADLAAARAQGAALAARAAGPPAAAARGNRGHRFKLRAATEALADARSATAAADAAFGALRAERAEFDGAGLDPGSDAIAFNFTSTCLRRPSSGFL